MHDARSYDGTNGNGYGVCLEERTTNCLIEDNYLNHLRHAILLHLSVNRNVISYNYSEDRIRETPLQMGLEWTGDLELHGNYSHRNLFESNSFEKILVDDWFGDKNGHSETKLTENGPYNVFLRNECRVPYTTPGTAPSPSICLFACDYSTLYGNYATVFTVAEDFYKDLLHSLDKAYYRGSNNVVEKYTVWGEPSTCNTTFLTFYQYIQAPNIYASYNSLEDISYYLSPSKMRELFSTTSWPAYEGAVHGPNYGWFYNCTYSSNVPSYSPVDWRRSLTKKTLNGGAILPINSVYFKNSFISMGNGGTIFVNGTKYISPTVALSIVSGTTIIATTVDTTINGILYTFNHWSDGSIGGANHQFTITKDTTITAYFSGKPLFENRVLHFNASDPDAPITVLWSEHPNTNVTQYKIWRKLRYNSGTTSNPLLIGTVNRGTTSFVDDDYLGSNLGYTKWMLFYDVKAYYATEGTYSDDNYVSVFSNGPLLKPGTTVNDATTIFCEKTEVYPNPFNPTTNIYFELSKPADVSIKIFNSLGREVTMLLNEPRDVGRHQVTFNGTGLPSGVYFYVIRAGQFSDTKKLMLIK